jgi:hypothetical protein
MSKGEIYCIVVIAICIIVLSCLKTKESWNNITKIPKEHSKHRGVRVKMYKGCLQHREVRIKMYKGCSRHIGIMAKVYKPKQIR